MNHFVNNFDPYKPLPPNLDNEYKTIMNPLLLIIGSNAFDSKYGLVNHKRKGFLSVLSRLKLKI